jgi:tetratricopeptide (TPR) repeat protein
MNSFENAVQAALAATQQGRLDDAERELHRAAEIEPASPIPYYLLAANLAEVKRNDEAEASFIACLSRAPDFAMARFQLGLLQLTNGRAASARATWERLLQLGEDSYLKHFVQGFEAILSGDRAAAEHAIHAGLALNNDNPTLSKDMHGVLQRMAALGADESTLALSSVVDSVASVPADDHVLIAAYRQS